MPRRKLRPLVQFDASYYKYPNNINLGSSKNYANCPDSSFSKVVGEFFADLSDDEMLCSLLMNHGVFVGRFFHQGIRSRVTRRFTEMDISLHKFQKLLVSASGFDHRIHNTSDAVWHIMEYILSRAMSRIREDSPSCSRLDEWIENFKEPRDCALCGNMFKVIDLPSWIYFGSNGCKNCCFQCLIVEAPRKAELARLIPTFVKTCGFIPSASTSPINYAFTSRLTTDQWVETILLYAKMGGIDHVKKKFGSWFKSLAETGALPDGVLSTARGIRCLAQDGHTCHSLDEQRIDDWLSSNGLPHEREPHYPAHPTLNSSGRRRADWKVRDIFIEYFGLVGDSNYEKKMDEKIALAQHCKIDLIAIYPADIENLEQKLSHLLN